MDDEVTKLVAELERLHKSFHAMAKSFDEYAATGGKYIGPDECGSMARYFEGKSLWLGELLAHHANDRLQPPAPLGQAQPGKPRLATCNGEPV